MKKLEVMTAAKGTEFVAILNTDGEIVFSDGSSSTEHLNMGLDAAKVFVAMAMFDKIILPDVPMSTYGAKFNSIIYRLGGKKPDELTMLTFNAKAKMNSVVMLDGKQWFVYGDKVTTSGNVFKLAYEYYDADYDFIDYIHYRFNKRTAVFTDGSSWDIPTNSATFKNMCDAAAKSMTHHERTSDWFKVHYFSAVLSADVPLSFVGGDHVGSCYGDAALNDKADDYDYLFSREVAYFLAAFSLIMFLSASYFFNQCMGAY